MVVDVLGISIDRALLEDPGQATGGSAIARQIRYAESVRTLTYIVYTVGNHWKPRQLAPNLQVYPTRSRSKIRCIVDAVMFGHKLIRDKQIDLLITQDPFGTGVAGYILKRLTGVPLMVQLFSTFYGQTTFHRERVLNRLLLVIGKWILRWADAVRVLTERDRQRIVAVGVNPDRVWVIPALPPDLLRFTRGDGTALRSRVLTGEARKIVLYVGRLSTEKGVDLLLRAMVDVVQKHPDTRCVIAGSGPEEDSLRRMAADLGLQDRVVFAGRVPYHVLPDYYAACDVFVLPSWYEGLAFVLFEAGAAAKPIVATRTENIAEVVSDGQTGFIVERGNAGQLAEKISLLLGDAQLRHTIGTAAQALVLAKFGPERADAEYRKMITMWEAAAAEGRKARA